MVLWYSGNMKDSSKLLSHYSYMSTCITNKLSKIFLLTHENCVVFFPCGCHYFCPLTNILNMKPFLGFSFFFHFQFLSPIWGGLPWEQDDQVILDTNLPSVFQLLLGIPRRSKARYIIPPTYSGAAPQTARKYRMQLP